MMTRIHKILSTLTLLAFLTFLPAQGWSEQSLAVMKVEYQSIIAKLDKHIVEGQWIDDNSESAKLLERKWSLTGEWVAEWLNTHPSNADVEGVKKALSELVSSDAPQCLKLDNASFLVALPGPIGSVFIVSRTDGHYKPAWSIASPQQASSASAEILAAWQTKNAVHGGRGPYWAASGRAGPVSPQIGVLPSDAKGHARFYIDGDYAQSAGVVVGMQTSLWLWDGIMAHPQLAKDYAVTLEQKAGTRMEGNLLKVQEKKSFRTFFTTGGTEERQVDWVVEVTPNGMKDLGEKVVVPELDAADELFYRLIHAEPVADIASPTTIGAAQGIIRDAQVGYSDKEWKEYPMVGEMSGWTVFPEKRSATLCLILDPGAYQFELHPTRSGFYIQSLKRTKDACPE